MSDRFCYRQYSFQPVGPRLWRGIALSPHPLLRVKGDLGPMRPHEHNPVKHKLTLCLRRHQTSYNSLLLHKETSRINTFHCDARKKKNMGHTYPHYKSVTASNAADNNSCVPRLVEHIICFVASQEEKKLLVNALSG